MHAPTILLLAALAADAPPPLAAVELPAAWRARYWAGPSAKALDALGPKELAALVPAQSGLKYCRCPACGAADVDDPLAWSAADPKHLACRRCKAVLPDDKFPAKVDGKVPAEEVEVRPREVHRYPYHALSPQQQSFPDERAYLDARRDHEAREALAKFALYVSIRSREAPSAEKRADDRRKAAAILVRCAEVYPGYACHLDMPGRAKALQPADPAPPYRPRFETGKWDATGCLDVPMNLAIAYAIVRDGPAVEEAGAALGVAEPRRKVERDLFAAAAGFVRRQPSGESEAALYAIRGMLVVGMLLDDRVLTDEATARLDSLLRRGFYHDGRWRDPDPAAHRRVVAVLDGWIARLLPQGGPPRPMIALARRALPPAPADEALRLASWPAAPPVGRAEGPMLLGGTGEVRLSVGAGADRLDATLLGSGDDGGPRTRRLALRLGVGGRPVLGDLDDGPPTIDGFDLATASHCAATVDGLNQREDPARLAEPAAGADLLFHAADADLQVATLADRRAYPTSATRYRRTLVAASGPRARYAVEVFEVAGGLQHDEFFHAAAGPPARWQPSIPMATGPGTLLPTTVALVPDAPAADGRWFLQAYASFQDLSTGRSTGPFQADLVDDKGRGVRLHVLGDPATEVVRGRSAGRSSLVVRRRSADGSSLGTAFVTLFEPVGEGPPMRVVGRAAAAPGAVVLAMETADGPEHLVVNLEPGKAKTLRLADGRMLATDGLVARVSAAGLAVAGGTFARVGERRAEQVRVEGTILAASDSAAGGWFEVSPPPPAGLEGRTLRIRHGDGRSRGWTIAGLDPIDARRARLRVVEAAGFRLDPRTNQAADESFPQARYPGPHTFAVGRIARSAGP